VYPKRLSKGDGKVVNFIVWIIVGAIIGWVASRIMGTSQRQGLLLDIVVGIVGALLAGWFLTPLFGISTINQANFSLPALMVSLLGAIILLAIVRVVRRAGRR
jgi:uncharacterized membrane protein YeaQ/YmgE (transglycosylase-associated protein family)